MDDFYEDCQCGEHHQTVKLAAPGDEPELPSWLSNFLAQIHDGSLEAGQIDDSYNEHVRADLLSAVTEGLGGDTFGAADYQNTLNAFLGQNVCAFSAARSLYENNLFRSFLTDADGNVLSEAQFIAKCKQVAFIDNVNS